MWVVIDVCDAAYKYETSECRIRGGDKMYIQRAAESVGDSRNQPAEEQKQDVGRQFPIAHKRERCREWRIVKKNARHKAEKAGKGTLVEL